MVRVVLVDDQKLFLESMKDMFKTNKEYSFVGMARGEKELFPLLENEKVDVVLMDVEIPSSLGRDGIELAQVLKSSPKYKSIKLISMSVNTQSYVIRVLLQEIGVDGYIDKSTCGKETVFKAIDTVLAGAIYTSPSLKDNANRILGIEKLSDREKQVLAEIINGKTTKEIAESLYIARKTVDNHRQNIHTKMKCKNVAELAESYYRYAYLQDYEHDFPNFKRKL